MAQAVEPKPADAPTLVVIIGQGVKISLGRQVREESGVKDSHLGHPRQQSLDSFNGLQHSRVVQGSQFAQAGNARLHLAVNQHTVLKLRSAVDHPVAHHRDSGTAVRAAKAEVEDGVDGQPGCGEIVGHRHARSHGWAVLGPHDQLSARPVAVGPINFARQ